jgi:hypothetical protein
MRMKDLQDLHQQPQFAYRLVLYIQERNQRSNPPQSA